MKATLLKFGCEGSLRTGNTITKKWLGIATPKEYLEGWMGGSGLF